MMIEAVSTERLMNSLSHNHDLLLKIANSGMVELFNFELVFRSYCRVAEELVRRGFCVSPIFRV